MQRSFLAVRFNHPEGSLPNDSKQKKGKRKEKENGTDMLNQSTDSDSPKK